MVVDRLGLGMLAVGAAGVAWLAWTRPPSPAPAPAQRAARGTLGPRLGARSTGPAVALPACEILPMGGELLHEPMRGPFASLAEDCDRCALDVKTMRGSARIDELTILHAGRGEPDLGSQHHLELAIRVGEHWYLRELGTIGPICGGLRSPTWLDATADAPQLCAAGEATFVTVVVHETADQGDSHRSWNSLVTCGVDEAGTPSCTERSLP